MANVTIPDLPSAIALDGTEQLEIVQPAGSGGTSKLTTTGAIANLSTTNFDSLPVTSDMNVTDRFAINSLTDGAEQIAFDNAMKTINGLTSLGVPSITDDYLVIYHAADHSAYKINVTSLGISGGNVPIGGTTGQVLKKNSGTNFDASWGAAAPVGGGTGLTSITAHNIIVGAGTSTAVLVAPSATAGVPLVSAGASADPAYGTATVPGGGTGLATLTAHNVLIGAGASAVALAAPGTAGQALVSAGAAADPVFGAVGPAGGGTGVASITAHNLIVGNGTSAVTLLPPSSTSGVAVVSQGASADPAYGTVVVSGGGTGLTALTSHNLMIGNGTSAATLLAPSATSGIPLVSQGSSSNPAYATAGVAGGGTGATSLTNHGILLGQGVAPVAATAVMTDGQILVGQSASDPLPKTMSGDATVAASGALTIANSAVTYAKIQNVSATSRILGRKTAGAGVVEELTGSDVATITGALTTTAGQTVVGGFILTVFDYGNKAAGSTITVSPANSAHQKATLTTTGSTAVTITAPSVEGDCILKILNGSGGTVTTPSFSGFDKVLTGDTFATGNGKINWIFIYSLDGIQAYMIKNMN